MLTAQIYKSRGCWMCRLYEPGGYVWHGQIAHTSFDPEMTEEAFTEECKKRFGFTNLKEADNV